MSLVDEVIEGHGGLDRWRQASAVSSSDPSDCHSWGTFIVVRLEGGYLPRMFMAWWSAKVRRSLVSFGWKMEDGPKVSGCDLLLSPRP